MKRWKIFNFTLCLLMALFLSEASGEIYFQENFNQGNFPYTFGYHKFGYSDNLIQTYHDSDGGVNNSGCHRIPLGGPSRTNFDVHFGKVIGQYVQNMSAYYLRYYLWVNPGFNTNPGQNWKLVYNYTNTDAPFVFWMRPTSDGQGFQPAFFSSAHNRDILRTENVPTFYLKDFKGQWICFEYYINLSTQTVKLWITTPGREYNQTLYINSNSFLNSGTSVTNLKIGAYWDGTGDSNYFKIDEVVISDQYIGPVDIIRPPGGLRILQ